MLCFSNNYVLYDRILLLSYVFLLFNFVYLTYFCFFIFFVKNVKIFKLYKKKNFTILNSEVGLRLTIFLMLVIPVKFVSTVSKHLNLAVRLLINLIASHVLLKIISNFKFIVDINLKKLTI